MAHSWRLDPAISISLFFSLVDLTTRPPLLLLKHRRSSPPRSDTTCWCWIEPRNFPARRTDGGGAVTAARDRVDENENNKDTGRQFVRCQSQLLRPLDSLIIDSRCSPRRAAQVRATLSTWCAPHAPCTPRRG